MTIEATAPFRMSFSRLAASSTDTVSALAVRLRRACGDDAWDRDVAEERWEDHRGLTLKTGLYGIYMVFIWYL